MTSNEEKEGWYYVPVKKVVYIIKSNLIKAS